MKNNVEEEEKINGLSFNTIVFLFSEMRSAEDKYRRTLFCEWNYEDLKNMRNAYKEIIERLGLKEFYDRFDTILTGEILSQIIPNLGKRETEEIEKGEE